MSRFIIDTIQRGEGYLAIICPDGALWKEASVGGGATERSAVSEAVNAHFTRQTESAVVSYPEVVPEVIPPADPFKRVETPAHVEALLHMAINRQGAHVGLEYEDYNDRRTSRIIEPRRINEGEFSWEPKRLIALDVTKGETRTFRMDRIKAVWNA